MRTVTSLVCWIGAISVLAMTAVIAGLFSRTASVAGYAPLVKSMCRLLIRCFPMQVRVEGLHRLDRRRSYIFIANHVNILDALMLEAHIPWVFSALEREKHFAWPFYGTFIAAMKHIPMSLDGGPGTAVAMRRADRVLRSGGSLVVMPEGNWSEDGSLEKFGRGAFRLAQRNKVPIAPIVQAGFFHAIPSRQWMVRGGPVRFVFGDPIDPCGHPALTDVMLADLARERMLDMLKDAGDRGKKPPRRGTPRNG